MNATRAAFRFLSPLAILFTFASATVSAQQKMDSTNEDRVKLMLKKAYDEVKKNYYDPKIHGLDWDARYQEYE
jgi:Tricorn protease C1 domain